MSRDGPPHPGCRQDHVVVAFLDETIAMPRTGALIGTPASMSASVEPQTRPSTRSRSTRASPTRCDRVREVRRRRIIARAHAERAHRGRCPAASAPHEARLPDRVRREVEWCMKRRSVSSDSRRSAGLLRRAERERRQPASGPRKEAEPWRAGLTPTSTSIGRSPRCRAPADACRLRSSCGQILVDASAAFLM